MIAPQPAKARPFGLLCRVFLLTWIYPLSCFGQAATEAVPASCSAFLGNWSGTWSQGYYGTQRIHVTRISQQCVATLAYSPTEAMPEVAYQVPIQEGIMAFPCNIPGGACRLEVLDGELRFTYKEPSGFVNIGTFRKERP